ncbi:putative F-box protein At1g49610 [Tasmannia lanceolata]|uniref:putative F-box protein At1g49610 n=1 Tax=Tasmannia lanceolata TaxID=3420 RepID=UPI004062A36C
MKNDVDRISDLPDVILLIIISFLPMKFAVRTSILSRRWRYIWAQTPYLDFDEHIFIDDRSRRLVTINPREWMLYKKYEASIRFVDFVHRSLLHYRGDRISTFRLRFCYNGEHYNHINQWLHFTIRRHVQELDLDFSGGGYALDIRTGYRAFELPNYLFACETLNVLRLSYCKFNPLFFKIFASLKALSLIPVELSSELVSRLLNSCGVLEMLKLDNCHGLSNLNIWAPNLPLKSLTIYDCRLFPVPAIHIRASMLLSFDYFGPMVRFDVEKMPNLVEARLDFGLESRFDSNGGEINQLLGSLENAMVLTVCSYVIQLVRNGYNQRKNAEKSKKVLPIEELLFKCLPTLLYNLKNLTFKIGLDNSELPGIAWLLRSSPNLESLSIETGLERRVEGYTDVTILDEYSFGKRDNWESQGPPFNSLLYHLKLVKICGFTGWENEMRVVRYLLANSIVLEKMIIKAPAMTLFGASGRNSKKNFKLIRQVLALEKASRIAEIMFY